MARSGATGDGPSAKAERLQLPAEATFAVRPAAAVSRRFQPFRGSATEPRYDPTAAIAARVRGQSGSFDQRADRR